MVEVDLRAQVARVRAGMIAAQVFEKLVRWTLVGLVAVCAYLALARLWILPVGVATFAVFLPILACAWALRRGVSLRECAVAIDRRFGLEERVATALEGAGTFGSLLVADADRALRSADTRSLSRFRWPRETPFVGVAGFLATALAFLPRAERIEGMDPTLQAASQEERRKLVESARELPAGVAKETEEIAALLERGTPEAVREALARLQRLEEAASARGGDPSVSEGEREALRRWAMRASGSAAALARALETAGELPRDWNPVSPSVVKKLGGGVHAGARPSEVVAREVAAAGPSSVEARASVRRALERRDWPPEYDDTVRRYFSE